MARVVIGNGLGIRLELQVLFSQVFEKMHWFKTEFTCKLRIIDLEHLEASGAGEYKCLYSQVLDLTQIMVYYLLLVLIGSGIGKYRQNRI